MIAKNKCIECGEEIEINSPPFNRYYCSDCLCKPSMFMQIGTWPRKEITREQAEQIWPTGKNERTE
jgi:hypothetical protein